MIKVQELRIGNYVYCQNEINVIYGITKEGFMQYEKENSVYYCGIDEIKPIELTEEILLKCGFENAENFKTNKVFSKNRLYLTKWINKDFFIADWSYKKIKNIQHLHQLQNLYFALTNEELEIKL